MWSNDYPHPNMTFPHSREHVLHHTDRLPAYVLAQLVRRNAGRLDGLTS